MVIVSFLSVVLQLAPPTEKFQLFVAMIDHVVGLRSLIYTLTLDLVNLFETTLTTCVYDDCFELYCSLPWQRMC